MSKQSSRLRLTARRAVGPHGVEVTAVPPHGGRQAAVVERPRRQHDAGGDRLCRRRGARGGPVRQHARLWCRLRRDCRDAARPGPAAGRARTFRQLLGRFLDPLGQPVDGLGTIEAVSQARPVRTGPRPAVSRARLGPTIDLDVRVLNCFATCRTGQRLGLFAGSGVGKSTLLSMLAGCIRRHPPSDGGHQASRSCSAVGRARGGNPRGSAGSGRDAAGRASTGVPQARAAPPTARIGRTRPRTGQVRQVSLPAPRTEAATRPAWAGPPSDAAPALPGRRPPGSQ